VVLTRNPQGEHRIKDPAAQALKGAHHIADLLHATPWFKLENLRLRFGWGVVFPDTDMPQSLGVALPRGQVIDRMGCTRFGASIDQLFTAVGMRPSRYPNGVTKAFEAALCPRIDAQVSLADWFARDRAILDRLTSEQRLLLDHLDTTSRIAVRGTAGSGKTLLAMEKARRLAGAGQRVLLLCYNKPLAEHLNAHADGFEVATFHDFSFRLAQRAGLGPAVPKGKKAKAQFFRDELPLLVLEALDALPEERYEAVIVDEGQDFQPDWWDSVKGLLADPEHGTWYVFYDPVQDLYGGAAPAALDTYGYPLTHNCRNTKKIASFCGELSGADIHPYPSAPEGRDVERIECRDAAHVVREVGALFERLVTQQRVRPEAIVVLSTTSRKKSVLARAGSLGPVRLVPLDAAPAPNQVRFDSLFRFKGLEADVVILIDEAHNFGDRKAGMYVGASRARHLLVVVRVEP